MALVICLCIGLLVAYATASIAGSKGRDRTAWGMIGFFFGLIGLLVACCLSDKRSLQELDGAAYRR